MRAVLFVFLASAVAAQPAVEWVQTFDGDYATPSAIIATVDGGAVLVANQRPGGATVRPLVHKLDARGEVEWTWTGVRDASGAVDAVELPDGGVVVVTGPWSLGEDVGGDPSLVWLGADGSFEREVPVVVDGQTVVLEAVTLGPFGGAVAAGWSLEDGSEPRALLVYAEKGRANPFVAVLEAGRQASDVVSLRGGGLAVVGNEQTGTQPNVIDGFVARVEDFGEITWTQTTSEPFLWVDAAVGTADGGVAVVGDTAIYPDGAGAPVARVGPGGDLEWSRTVGVLEVAKPRGIANGPGGTFVVVGTASDDSTDAAFWAGLEGDGTTAWTLTTEPDGRDSARDIARAADGGHFVAGLQGVGPGIPGRPAVWKLSSQARRLTTPARFDTRRDLPLTLRNDTDAPVSFDSLSTGVGLATQAGGAWIIAGTYSDGGSLTAYCVSPRSLGSCELDGELRAVAPGETVELQFYQDPCPFCRHPPGVLDVLEVYSGGDADPVRVRLEADIIVSNSSEPATERAISLEVWPNPVIGSAVLEVAAPGPGALEVVAFDALGRRVAVLHDGPAAGALRLEVDTAAWPPGVYVVRATSRTATASARLVVAR